jgi:hypothetical protein
MKKILKFIYRELKNAMWMEEPAVLPQQHAGHIVSLLRKQFTIKEQNEILRMSLQTLIIRREQDIKNQTESLIQLKRLTEELKEYNTDGLNLVG